MEEVSLYSQAKELLNNANVSVNEIVDNRNYWFVRTEGGDYYDDFLVNDYISIGWDNVPCVEKDKQTDSLIKQISDLGYGQPRRVLNQVYRFFKEMKKGDVVVIPSTSSHDFAFGYLEEDNTYTLDENKDSAELFTCPFKRRRKVLWVAGIPKSRIDPKLFAFFRNQQAISNAREYEDYIERAINTLYIKNDIAHFTLSVESTNSPRAFDVPFYLSGLLIRVSGLAKELKVTDKEFFNSEELSTRINIQSPGVMEFFGEPLIVMLLAIVSISLFGGKAKFKHTDKETSGELSTDGLAGIVSKYLDYQNKKDSTLTEIKLREIQERMDIKNPSDKN